MSREPAGDKPILRSKLFRVGVLYETVPLRFHLQAMDRTGEFEL